MAPRRSGGPVKVFFSYSHRDKELRNKLATHLIMMERQGIITSWYDRKILPGDEWEREVAEHLENADVILLLVSPDFLASDYCHDVEMKRAIERHKTGDARVIPVILRSCDWKGSPIGELKALPTDGRPVTHWRSHDDGFFDVTMGIRRVIEEIGPVGPVAPVARAQASVWQVPFPRNDNFIGREDQLRELRDALISSRTAALGQAIHGLGGVGKTQLALEYAYRHSSDYAVVWWVRSEGPAELASDFSSLAGALDLPEREATDQDVAAKAVRLWLEHNDGWLLIFDNVVQIEDVRECLPRAPTGHVIITSRNPNWAGVAGRLGLDVWQRAESVEFLLDRTTQTDKVAAVELAEALGDFPLALAQARSYVEQTGLSLRQYLNLFRTRQRELLDIGTAFTGYELTAATTWESSFQEIEARNPAAADLLNLCAFLAPDAIPIDLIRERTYHLPQRLAKAARDDVTWAAAISALRRYSLMEVSGDSLSVHRLVQAAARGRLPEDDRKAWADAAVRLVNGAFPFGVDTNVETWAVCARLLPHALVSTDHAERFEVAPEAAGRLLNRSGLYLQERAQFANAKDAFERAVRIRQRVFAPDHPTVAMSVNNLGLALRDLGDLAGARAAFQWALRINEQAYGPDGTEVATNVNNLGTVLQYLGDLEGARVAYERALRIDEGAYGPDHPEVARDVYNVGRALLSLGDLAGARAAIERALRITEHVFGLHHPDVALELLGFGRVLQYLGDLEGARAAFERALDIFRRILGDDHPNTVTARKNLELLPVQKSPKRRKR